MPHFFGREHELLELREFLDQPRSGLTFVRGRRRVGKTWLLKNFIRKLARHQDVFPFYYMGSQTVEFDLVFAKYPLG